MPHPYGIFSLSLAAVFSFFLPVKDSLCETGLHGSCHLINPSITVGSLCPPQGSEARLLSSPTPYAAFCSPAPAPLAHLFLPALGHLGHLLTWFRSGVGPSDPVDLGCFGQLKPWCQATHKV